MSVVDRIASLAPEQRALFEKLLARQKKTERLLVAPPVPRVSGATGAGDWPLSYDQERFWFMEQMSDQPGSAGLNITAATRMSGPLAVDLLAAALGAIVARHAAWRTSFPVSDGKPRQRVVAARRQRLALIDLTALPPERREGEALRLVGEDVAAPFDLERGPLVRSSLVRVSAEDHVCLLTVHHLVTDWISFQIAWAELAALYERLVAAREGRAAALPPPPEPPVHYPDFAVWQRQWLQGEALDELIAWWREALAGVPLALDLPTDRPRLAVARMRGGRLPVALSGELSAGLRSLARGEGATLFMATLAATAALIHRESGQEKLILGANNANRNRPEIEPVLGCFLTQVPFPLDLAGDPTFRELLARARRSALGAYAHQDLPFGKLVEAVQPPRDPSRQPLVQALVQVLDGQYSRAEIAGAAFAPVDSYDGKARYDLMLSLFDYPDGITGSLEYDADLFDAATVMRKIERLLLLASAVVAEADLPLSALPALSAAARQQVEVEWNDTFRPLPAWTVPARFAALALAAPDRVAVRVPSLAAALSFGELDRRAARLARRLLAAGAGPGARSVLLLPRGSAVMVAILAVWKAGGAYVPLDPATPVARLSALFADCEPAAVIHSGALPAGLDLSAAVRCFDLASAPASVDADVGGATEPGPLPAASLADLAYLLYTSGTTGFPKAVAVEHGSIAAFLEASVDRLGLTPEDRAPLVGRHTFDVSFLELFAPLLAGGSTEILTLEEVLDPELLLQAASRATRIFGVPALLRRLAATALERGPGSFSGLRTLAAGGDAVPPDLQATLLAAFPDAEVEIIYGPTETTVVCTAWTVSRLTPPRRTMIGRPLPGVEVLVVDPRSAAGVPVPMGVPGELWIGGPGVARGYFKRPEQTAERFVTLHGRRYYRSGDLVRQVVAEGGALEFLGRTDLQVKVRGFRIEPGEIEAALAAHGSVRESVVVARAVTGAELQLVAYVVMGGDGGMEGAAEQAEEMRAFLRSTLPEHLVPSFFVFLPAMPLSSHGKIDRAALPAPEVARAGSGEGGVTAPRNAREALLAEIWCGVLGRETVGIHDNFFALGGDSILSIQVVARARRAGLVLSPKQFFEQQTVAALAAVAGTVEGKSAVVAGPAVGEVPLTPVQRRFFAEERAEVDRFNQALLLVVRGVPAGRLRTAIEELARAHDALRLRFREVDGEWRQVYAPVSETVRSAPVVEVDLRAVPAGSRTEALEAAVESLQGGFDLVAGPVFLGALFRMEKADRLLVAAHHLVVDGVSWRILLEDLGAMLGGEEVGPRTTGWGEWAARLVEHSRSAELAGEVAYWAGMPAGGEVPVEVGEGGGVGTVAVEMEAGMTRALVGEVGEIYGTRVDEVLVAALVRVIGRWSGAATVWVEMEGHGREEIFTGVDLSRTVGWFTTVFPVALAVGGELGESIRGVKEGMRSVPGRGLGFGVLRWLGEPAVRARMAAVGVPEISFNYLGQLDQSLGGMFGAAPERVRGTDGGGARKLFSVDALILADRLRVSWTYDSARCSRATAEALAAGWIEEVGVIVDHCLALRARGEVGGYTPSDFPLARLNQATLDRVIGREAGIEDVYPLAPLQQGMLFHTIYTPGSELYFEQLVAELHGPLAAAAFERCWQRVVDRHAVLRTGFVWRGVAVPLQVVRRAARLPWSFEDWREVAPAALDEKWRQRLAADRALGFDLASPPLARLTLVSTGETEHRLAWSFHHLLFDGWCFSLLLGEVFALYAAALAGQEAELPRPRPYRDYIAWLARRDAAAEETWWRRALVGFSSPTPLPFDTAAGGEILADDFFERTRVLPTAEVAALERLAQRLRVTLGTLVQGAWALLLSRTAQEEDVVFGAVVSGRPADLPGVESMVGLFINTVPVRVAMPRSDPAAAWLARLQADQFELRQHEWTPLARVQALAEVPAGEPLFATLLAFENYPVDPAVGERLGGLRIGAVGVTERTNYPLTLTAVARGDLALKLTASRRFAPATAERLLSHLENLLRGLAADPERPLGALPFLGEAQRHQMVREWNDTAAVYPAEASLGALFSEQAARRPSAPALRSAEGEVTYGELARRSGLLAAELVRRGVGRGDVVGICAERSVELVVALLAILRAGAAYLPLDPAYPRERLEWMLGDVADAGEPWVLVQPHLSALLPRGARILPLGAVETGMELPAMSASRALPAIGGGDLAYVLYTSGSTGRPKGVAVPHRAVARLVRGDCTPFGPDEVFLMLAPVSFDASTLEIWGPLANGGCLAILPPDEVTLDALEATVRELDVTTLWLTTGLFHLVADERPGALAPLRQLLTGGDVLSPAHVARLRRLLPHLRLINAYGPTEGTTFTTCHAVSGDPGEEDRSVPIGRPIANTLVLVLDRELDPVPVGVAGELYAGGAGLALGYLGRVDLTAASFVPAPTGAGLSPGERLYATGDRVRRLADGSLDFLGRGDRQVKLRGFRVEPGEIEAVLALHPAVREAVVVVSGGSGEDAGEKRLTAWLTGDGAAATGEVLAHLAARLPAHMVPAEAYWLDGLPLGPTGKVDRAALMSRTARGAEGAGADEGFVAPRGDVEERIAAVWRAVLRRERIGVHDDFFRLGGDSILSIQVVARLRQAGLAVTPRELFEAPTIASLASLASQSGLLSAAVGEAAAEQGAVVGEVPLTPVQHWFFAGRPVDPHHFNQSLLLLPRSPHASGPLAVALTALAAHHDALRLRFTRAGSGWMQWSAAPQGEPDAPLHVVDLGSLPAGRRSAAVTAAASDFQGAFDLASGPLLRAARFELGAGDPGRLLLLAHHLVVDGVSWRILLEDLEAAYSLLAAGRPAVLPAKTTSCKRWAERLVELAAEPEARGELNRWLAAPADILPLPRDLGEEAAEAPALATVASASAALPREDSRFLLGAGPAVYRAGVEDLLLAALARAFARWTAPASGETRLRLDLEGHGREEVEPGLDLSRTVGWFTAIYPVVLEGKGETSPRDAIRAAKEALRAIPRRGLGYGLLRWLRPEETADLAARPSPEVSFNYLGQLDSALGSAAPFAPAPEHAGPEQSPRAGLRHLVEVNAWVLDDQLHASFAYSRERLVAATVERLAGDFMAALAELLAHCAGAEAGGWSPSDFPLAGPGRIDQATLDSVFGVGAALDRMVEDVYPLAPLQGGMLFQGLYAPAAELYFEHLTATLEGPLDVAAFTRAWQGVIDRHPALRTGFLWNGVERPLQVVRRGVELPWTHEDWRHVERDELARRLDDWLAADRARGFDLARPPLTRAALLRTGEAEHRFVWSFHHLLIDGWCFSPLLREVLALYQAETSPGGAAGPRLPAVRPYREFIAWAERQDRGAAEGYFRRLLAGFTAPTRLPLDRPGAAAIPSAMGELPREREIRLPPSLVAALSALGRRRGLTLNTLVQGAWAVLLARFGGERDVVFGTVVSGRPAELPGVESMVGLFINTLPARLRVDPGAPLAAWLAGVQAGLLELRQHETVALAAVQRASEVPPGEPLFASLVAFENYPVDESLGEGSSELQVTAVEVSDRTDYPLSLAALPGRRAGLDLALRLAFDRQTDGATASRLLAHLELLLGAFAADSELGLEALPALAAAERHQIVAEWNDTPAPTADLCLHELVAAQARRTPDATAIVEDRGEPGKAHHLSYGELDRRAARLARRLRRSGVGMEAPVALVLERSLAAVEAILGVLVAGGAYLPLDPETPAERLAVLLRDAKPVLVLASAEVAARLVGMLAGMPAGGARPPVLVVGAAAEPPGSDDQDESLPAVGPGHLAYILYTSGTTGTPKGVLVEHRAAAYARVIVDRYGLGPGDRELQFAPLFFDPSVEEIFTPLASGATVVLRQGPTEEPERFLAACADVGITVLSLPTAYWHQVATALEGGEVELPPGVRLIVVGGERALPERWSAWGRRASVRLFNAYGPTEATIAATLDEHPGTADPLSGRREVSIGRPLPGVRAVVAGADLQPLPIGAPGELLLGGVGLARGYLDRPELTAASFVPDPAAGLGGSAGAEPGARLYRTGDLACSLPDGRLELAGRRDTQVKVRGFRIELGEVETALAAHPGVREAAAGVREDAAGGNRLVGYVVARDPAAVPPAESLLSHLGVRLPAFMVPSQLVFLSALPATATEKLDRRALALLGTLEPAAERPFRAPGNAVEASLAAIWSQLLAVERVGLDDDFFALGGHSLLATQLASRVRRELGVELPLPRIFELRTLSSLAAEVLARTLAAEVSPIEVSASGPGPTALDSLLAELDGLSEEEALSRLQAEEWEAREERAAVEKTPR